MPTDDGNFFKVNRERLKLSQFQLAVILGVSAGAVAGWERGSVPSIDLVDKIAEVFGCSSQRVMNAMLEMSRTRQQATSA